jgi:hypothetical protein
MHVLYLDDSGSPDNPKEDYFVLGGISVPENSLRWLSHQIEKIAIEINRENPEIIEFHAAEIFRGVEPPWDTMNKGDRIKTIQNVLRTIDSANQGVVIFACAVHKASFPAEDPVIKAYEEITGRFDLYLQRLSAEGDIQRGLVVIDKSSYETGLQKLASQIRRSGNKWGSFTKQICEVPLFIDSRASRITQLADHIAYAVFRRYQSADINYFNRIEGRFDRKDNVICGLVHRQTYNFNCTCPACITRRDRS